MSKICLLGDVHIGIKDGSQIMHHFFSKTYVDWLFPELQRRGIRAILQLGDLYDRRKGVDSYSIDESNKYFFNRLEEFNIEMTTLLGNHDVAFRETLEVNSPTLLLGDCMEVDIIDRPTTLHPNGGGPIDIIPWICKDNQAEIMEFIKNSKSSYCFGHFELAGFAMYKNVEAHGGMSPAILSRYKQVYSGHFHTRSQDKNITYVGTPCELTWSDCDDPRGVHIFDTDTGEIEFIQNPYTLYAKLRYNEDEPMDFKDEMVQGKFVKLFIENRTDFKKFDKFIEKLNNAGPHELKIVEDHSEFNDVEVREEVELDDTPSMLNAYVESLETDLDKDRLKALMKTLYVEAQVLQ